MSNTPIKTIYTYHFEKLDIWQLSVDMSVEIYKITKYFPSEEKFGIISQIRRASNSVSANIAEGMSRSSSKDKARFIQIAYGSAIEVLSHLILANRLEFIDDHSLDKVRINIMELTNKINAFHKSILKN